MLNLSEKKNEEEETRKLAAKDEKKSKNEEKLQVEKKRMEEERNKKDEEDKQNIDLDGIGPLDEVHTPTSFTMLFIIIHSYYKIDMPMPTNEVENIDLFTFNGKRKQIVRQTHKRRNLTMDWGLILTT